MQMLKGKSELEGALTYLGLMEKAREIFAELGSRAVLSYLKSSYRLLSKVYHPDLNPENSQRAKEVQQRLNRVGRLIDDVKDEEIIELIGQGAPTRAERKMKILVVEDEFGLQEIFRDIFLMEGYDVRVAVDGDKGYEVFIQFQPDLVFTDVVMPKMNGLEMVRKIREVNPRIKVIYVSGFFGIKGLKKELDEDILKYAYPTLSKPFKTSAMLELVKLYAVLASGDRLQSLRMLRERDQETAAIPILSPEASYLVMDILKDNPPPQTHRVPLSVVAANQVAWKTGTSYGFGDAWAVGVSAGKVVAVWVGNFDDVGNRDFIGRTAAVPCSSTG